MSLFSFKKKTCLLSACLAAGFALTAGAVEPPSVAQAHSVQKAGEPASNAVAPVVPPTAPVAGIPSATAEPAKTQIPEQPLKEVNTAVVATPKEVTQPEGVMPPPAAPVVEKSSDEKVAKPVVQSSLALDSEEQKRAYASGVALAHYIEDQVAQQKALHITLNKDILISGMMDTFNHQGKMSDGDVNATLSVFDEQLKVLLAAEGNKRLAENNAFLADYAQQNGVRKSLKGFYYRIEDKGEGREINDSTQVAVRYHGALIDGTVVDQLATQNANQIFRVEDMIPALRDTIKVLHKGGRIEVVIPPSLVPKNLRLAHPVPENAVLIYTMDVIDVHE